MGSNHRSPVQSRMYWAAVRFAYEEPSNDGVHCKNSETTNRTTHTTPKTTPKTLSPCVTFFGIVGFSIFVSIRMDSACSF